MSNPNPSTRSQLYWNTILRIPSQALSVVVSILVARILEPKDFGVMGIAMMLIGYSNLITNFGFTEAVVQKRIHDKKVLNSIFTFNLGTSSFIALLFISFSGHIANFFQSPECEDVIKVMSVVFIITSFAGIPTAILKRDMNFKCISLFDFTSSLLMNSITLALALKGFGYWALAYGQVIPLLLMTISLCIKTKWIPMICYNLSSLKGIVHFGKWNFANTQLGFITQHVDKFVVGRWLGPTSLGFYDKAVSLAEMPYNSLTMNINSVMFSSFSKVSENKHELQLQFKKSLTLLSIINLPIYFGLIATAPYFVNVLLGSKWAPMIMPFQVILASMLVKSFGGLTASLNVAVGKYKEFTMRSFVAFVIFAIACLLLVRFDIVGIAISYCLLGLIQMYLWMRLSLESIDLSWRDAFLAVSPGAGASILMFFMANVMTHFVFADYSLMNMILIIGLCTFIYCVFVALDRSQLAMDFKSLVWEDIKSKASVVSPPR